MFTRKKIKGKNRANQRLARLRESAFAVDSVNDLPADAAEATAYLGVDDEGAGVGAVSDVSIGSVAGEAAASVLDVDEEGEEDRAEGAVGGDFVYDYSWEPGGDEHDVDSELPIHELPAEIERNKPQSEDDIALYMASMQARREVPISVM